MLPSINSRAALEGLKGESHTSIELDSRDAISVTSGGRSISIDRSYDLSGKQLCGHLGSATGVCSVRTAIKTLKYMGTQGERPMIQRRVVATHPARKTAILKISHEVRHYDFEPSQLQGDRVLMGMDVFYCLQAPTELVTHRSDRKGHLDARSKGLVRLVMPHQLCVPRRASSVYDLADGPVPLGIVQRIMETACESPFGVRL